MLEARNRIGCILAALGVVLVIAILAGSRLLSRLENSVQVFPPQGPAEQLAVALTPPTKEEESHVARELLAVGLNFEPVLGDTAISGHLARLERGEVNEETLLQYAADLAYLNAFTAQNGALIPTDFWDVRTAEMTANNWDEYAVAHQTAVPEAAPYLRLLAQGYGRFLTFKAGEETGNDTALDAALDMMALVDGYYEASAEPPAEADPEQLAGFAEGKLLVWQSLVAGSTRQNPLNGEPLFSHSIFARDNVHTIYQYEIDQEMSISEVWGVTGFASQFVGPPENRNQVEHLSISIILQMILDEPVAALDAIEEAKVAQGGAAIEEARADMALNNAIHTYFAPFFVQEGLTAVERLRCVLKSAEKEPAC